MNINQDVELLVEAETAILKCVTELLVNKGLPAEAVAAVMAKTTYSIYKSILSPTDYQQMTRFLYDYRMDVRSFGQTKDIMDRQLN